MKLNHTPNLLIGEINSPMKIRKQLISMLSIINLHHISKIEHKNIDETFQDQYWISALHEKLDKVARNDV